MKKNSYLFLQALIALIPISIGVLFGLFAGCFWDGLKRGFMWVDDVNAQCQTELDKR